MIFISCFNTVHRGITFLLRLKLLFVIIICISRSISSSSNSSSGGGSRNVVVVVCSKTGEAISIDFCSVLIPLNCTFVFLIF